MIATVNSLEVAMNPASQRSWAVLLAGGDGTRLQNLTLRISGDSRPKQFCNIHGDGSLLQQTRQRVSPIFPAERTMYLVSEVHEEFYRDDLADVDRSLILSQPGNKGTAVGILWAVQELERRDPEGLVILLPCDHYYSDTAAFLATVTDAIDLAFKSRESLVLLGAQADQPEVEYGWIEPGKRVSHSLRRPAWRVSRFWEKPSLPHAEALLQRGCLWNTFVTVGHVGAVHDLLRTSIPAVVRRINASSRCELGTAYREVPSMDFSRDVLARHPERLLVIRDTSGWADLGNPCRVVDTLVKNGVRPAWLSNIPSAYA
jgi:mannose-1-phosphate guanylyltransferase